MAQATETLPDGVKIAGHEVAGMNDILTPEACAFVADLQREFNNPRESLLGRRAERQARIDAGYVPDFLEETREIREGNWTVTPVPPDLLDRRVEITGPVDRKMIINALNSGARVFMADFEDANSPTWQNNIEGQVNLRDAVSRTITYSNGEGKHYCLNDDVAVLMVRPRGWHLIEKHMLVDEQPVSASLFDFGLYFFHNVGALLDRGTGPYFYLPKLQSHLEARLWNDVFNFAQDRLGIPRGTIRATVLIEHVLAALEADEILYELRDHSAGLNCGRWDYIFSFIKTFRARPDFVLADRAQLTMTTPMMRSYALHVIKTCHRRGAHAIGGMAAWIPDRSDPDANARALNKVREDKLREVTDGHDGTWVAHPGLVPVAKEVFDAKMPTPHQIERRRDDIVVAASDLLAVPTGDITEAGLRTNVSVGVQYLEAWLRGNGCVPLYNLMEDAATAEISRAQIWQWIHQPTGVLNDGRKVSVAMIRTILAEELDRIQRVHGTPLEAGGTLEVAAELFCHLSTAPQLAEYLTIPAYEHID